MSSTITHVPPPHNFAHPVSAMAPARSKTSMKQSMKKLTVAKPGLGSSILKQTAVTAMKKPAAGGLSLKALNAHEDKKGGIMNLDDKLKNFEKSKHPDIHDFFDKLSDGEKQTVWKRFEYARKKENLDVSYKAAASGNGSADKKFELLTLFLKSGQSCKGKDMQGAHWQVLYICIVISRFMCL